MSAVMHNAAFMELGLDFAYQLLEVRPEDLERAASGTLRAPDVRGASVTIPHKVSVMGCLDEIDLEAVRIGAVNIIVNDGGKLKGYNTDGIGALRAIGERYGDLGGARAVILGAGGAARAISYKLAENVSEVTILNRTPRRAEELSDYLSSLRECRAEISSDGLSRDSVRASLVGADILINTTPLGMHPDTEASPVDQDLLRPDLLVFDAVYNPPMTRLLREAEASGSMVLAGVNMLVYQGVVAFELWTGREAPEAVMMGSVLDALGGGES
jgi:shikimate dehydrogenase